MADELTLLDVGEIEEQLRTITAAITENRADNITTFFRDLLIRLKVTERTIGEYKRFIPIIYPQMSDSTNDGIFQIQVGPFTTTTQVLLMMIPRESAIDTATAGINKLQLIKDGVVSKEFEIYKESNLGGLVKATFGDIVPNRAVLFRLIYSQLAIPRAVIINASGLFSETISNLYVTGEVVFGAKPIIANAQTTAEADRLVSKAELDALETKVDKGDDRFIFTEDNAKTVAEDAATPDGAVIIQIQHD